MTAQIDKPRPPFLDPYDYAFHEDPYPYYKRLRDEAHDIHDRAGNHDRTEAEPRRQRAGDRLQEAPGEILDGDRQREVGDGDVNVICQRLHEQTEALTQTHAEAEHD